MARVLSPMETARAKVLMAELCAFADLHRGIRSIMVVVDAGDVPSERPFDRVAVEFEQADGHRFERAGHGPPQGA